MQHLSERGIEYCSTSRRQRQRQQHRDAIASKAQHLCVESDAGRGRRTPDTALLCEACVRRKQFAVLRIILFFHTNSFHKRSTFQGEGSSIAAPAGDSGNGGSNNELGREENKVQSAAWLVWQT
jgi:hypothetical protein